MSWLNIINSGIQTETSEEDTRYIRFLNTTLIIFAIAQLPIIPILAIAQLSSAVFINSCAFSLLIIGYFLNRNGKYLIAKFLTAFVIMANTLYFSLLVGSNAPTHLWLIPSAMFATFIFKPAEWIWGTVFVTFTMLGFIFFELNYLAIEPILNPFTDELTRQSAARSSSIFAIILTLVLAAMMHKRFAQSEKALALEKEQSDRLLKAILPVEIAQELKDHGSARAVRHEDVSLLFADIVGFTPLAASMPAEEVVALLAQIFQRFDELIESYGVEKIKTIGDAYMIAGGVPNYQPEHADKLGDCALGMLKIMQEFNAESEHSLQIRIGLHRRPAVAGVIGTTKFAYDLWGESVNLASRLESSGEPGRIHVSEVYQQGSTTHKFEERGQVMLKGVGQTKTYWLLAN